MDITHKTTNCYYNSQTMQNRCSVVFSKLDYRNALYHGSLQNFQRNGFGIVLSDQSQMIIADWIDNRIQGRYCYISERAKGYGEVIGRRLEGLNVIEIDGMMVYASFKQGHLHGRVIVTREQSYASLNFQKGRMVSKGQEKQTSETALVKLLQKEFPQVSVNLSEYLQKLVEDCRQKSIPFGSVQFSEKDMFFGKVDENGKADGLGCVVRNISQLYSCGTYQQNELNGLGRIYLHQSCVQDGAFKHGKAKGVLITHNRVEDESTVVINGNRKTQKGNPRQLIKQIRKEFHLRSATFSNEIIVPDLLVGVDFQTFIKQHIQIEQPKKQQISQVYKIYNMDIENGRYFRKTGEQEQKMRTNKRMDLFLDDIEDEEVSGSSPIKEVNAMQILDSSHFVQVKKNQKIHIEEPSQSHQTPQVYFQRITPIAKQSHNTSKTSEKTKVTTHSTKSNKSQLVQKDAYSMVKHLQDQQQRKRIDLHKIYRQTGLVSKARKFNR